MKKSGIESKTIGLMFLGLLVIMSLFLLWNQENKGIEGWQGPFQLSYYEDSKGTLSFTEILGRRFLTFKGKSQNALVIGQSRSVWWVKIEGLQLEEATGDRYLSVANPSVEKLELFVPLNGTSGAPYLKYKAGWGFSETLDEESFIWPVFKLSVDQIKGKPIYLKLSSPYSQNYRIHFLEEKEYESLKLKNTAFFSIFVGFLFAMGIINLIHYFSLGHNVYIRYVGYIFFMILYQCALLGLYHIWLSTETANALISNIIVIGALMLMTSLVFFQGFLDTRKVFPKSNKAGNALLGICIFIIALMILNRKFEASVLATITACFIGVLILGTSILAVKKGIRQARFFLVGWVFMVFGILVFSLRVYGLIPNNSITLSIVALCSSIEAIFLSVALDDYYRILRRENTRFELAFLQAQINPHFLFNTLNVIAALCRINPQKAYQMIIDLSEYMHYCYTTKKANVLVPIDEEIKFIDAYVRIEQERFPDSIEMSYELSDVENLMVPKLLLQPLVENAIRHGIRKGSNSGMVYLSIKKEQGEFLFKVVDNGIGISEEQLALMMDESAIEQNNGVGVTNVRKRLRKIYNRDLKIESKIGLGTTIQFTIPVERQKNESNFSR